MTTQAVVGNAFVYFVIGAPCAKHGRSGKMWLTLGSDARWAAKHSIAGGVKPARVWYSLREKNRYDC